LKNTNEINDLPFGSGRVIVLVGSFVPVYAASMNWFCANTRLNCIRKDADAPAQLTSLF
jgi:hypothetical protein